MIADYIAIAIFIFVALNIAAYFCTFFERKLVSRIQQRSGLGGGHYILGDFLKQINKKDMLRHQRYKVLFVINFTIKFLLPYFFCFCLFLSIGKEESQFSALLILYLILFSHLAIDYLLSFFVDENRTNILIRKRQFLSILGVTAFIFSTIPPVLYFGEFIIEKINFAYNARFIFSPFAILSLLFGFISLFFIAQSPPVVDGNEKEFAGALDGLIAFSKHIWIISLSSFLIILYSSFWLGLFGYWGILFLLAELIFALFVFFFIQKIFPLIRIKNSLEFGFRKLLPISFLLLVCELLWITFVWNSNA